VLLKRRSAAAKGENRLDENKISKRDKTKVKRIRLAASSKLGQKEIALKLGVAPKYVCEIIHSFRENQTAFISARKVGHEVEYVIKNYNPMLMSRANVVEFAREC
jgi:hypothetical protein